ncbi:MAG: U32 family peptidase [Parcubacteria group bacterium]
MDENDEKKLKFELLAPAGNLEKLKYAFAYGADAVYCGVPDFSLRVRINKFDEESLRAAAEYAQKRKKKIYITLNIYAHNAHLERIAAHLKFLRDLKIDGVIVSDPGIINLVKKYLPAVDIHLSTQANVTNIEAVKFWQTVGVKRIVLAREVTLSEIREIKKAVPKMELEYFIHGAMCMSYSGRCILSKWMSGKSANLGDCTQPCRWKYKTVNSHQSSVESDLLRMSVVDDKGKFEMDLEENQQGTYFFNSKDLNLSAHIQDLAEAGVTSFKIEGRAKSAYYVAVVTRAYRKIIAALGKSNLPQVIRAQQKELDNLVNRGYTKGFLLGAEPEHNFSGKLSGTPYKFCGVVEGKKKIDGKVFNIIFSHNEMYARDAIEAVTPDGNLKVKIKKALNCKLEKVLEIHGGHENRFFVQFDQVLSEMTLLRRKN